MLLRKTGELDMDIQTRDLIGAALDWAVAKCEGYTDFHRMENRWDHEPHFAMRAPRREYGVVEMWELGFSTDWAQGGPIIEREGIAVDCVRCSGVISGWVAAVVHEDKDFDGFSCTEESGTTPLVAAMRCYVASKLGDVVDVPDELMGD